MNKIITGIFAAAVVTAFAVGYADAQTPTSGQTPTSTPAPTTVPQGAPSTGHGGIQ
jgi:hypothetical protein